MIERLSARPLVQRGLSVATAGLLVAGSLFVPAAVHAAGNPPVAVDDTVTAVEDTQLVIPASDLTSNDTDADGDPLTVTTLENVIGGTVVLNAGNITITPVADDCGTNQIHFQYDVIDGPGPIGIDGIDVGDVSVDITCVNDAPVAVNDHDPNGHQDDPLVINADDLASNDTDVDEDALHVTAVSNPTGGAVALVTGTITFTPTAGLCGANAGAFDYTVSDGHLGTDTGHVTIDLMCSGTNHDPVAGNDLRDGTEDTALHLTFTDLLANDSDADSDPLTISGVSLPVGGTAAIVGSEVVFTPTADLCGAGVASFTYDLFDGIDGDDFGVVTISLTCVNDAPVAVADSGSVNTNSGPASYDVLANDTDVDGDTLTLQAPLTVSPPTAGAASYVTGKVQFTPAAAFKGQATITYHVFDGTVAVAGTLKVDVGIDLTAPVVAVPSAAFGSGRVNESAPIRIGWAATDAGSGVAKYQVQVSVAGGAFRAVYTGTGRSIVKSYPFGKTLVWRVRATDKDGNVSGWKSSATRKITAIQENSSAIHHTGRWTRVISHSASGSGYGFTSTNHKAAGAQFTARSVLYVAPKSRAAGWVKVYVDGHLIGRFNAHTASFHQGRIIARASWATNGAHTILIVNDQAGKRAHLDAFVILR